jgi:hypothetical protein
MRAALPLRLLAAVCVAMGLFPLANTLRSGSIPWWNAAVLEWATRGFVVVLIAVLASVLAGSRVDSVVERAKAALLSPSSKAFATTIAVLGFAAAASVSIYCFARQPFTTDEMVQQWHARILLSGHLVAVPETLREFFNTSQVLDENGRWFSHYPIGAPAFIALGMILNATWLVNPVLLGLGCVALYRFLASAFDELTARVTSVLFVLSPMVLIMAGSQMNHVPALTFTLVALAALAKWDRATDAASRRHQATLIGFAVGVVILVRPLDGALVGAVVFFFQLWRLVQERDRWSSIRSQVIAGGIPVLALLLANGHTTGQPLLFGYEALYGRAHTLGFHLDPNGEMHTPARGLAYVSGYLMRMSRYLFEWPLPGVAFVVAGLVAVRRPSRWDVVLATLVLAFLGVYVAYWGDAFFAGPRFLYTVVPAFIYFAARAPAAVAASNPLVRRAVVLLIPMCVLTSWSLTTGVSSATARVALYHDQRTKLKTDIEAQVRRAGLHDALVFVNEGWRGRLLARLRVLGISSFRAEHLVSTLDACALETALDAEDMRDASSLEERAERVVKAASASGAAKPAPGLQADQVIALVPGSRPTDRCRREFDHDAIGTMAYPLFLARQHVNDDGHIGGDVVFVRDLLDRNYLLRERFGGRTWYRYRAPRSLEDTTPPFVRYDIWGQTP